MIIEVGAVVTDAASPAPGLLSEGETISCYVPSGCRCGQAVGSSGPLKSISHADRSMFMPSTSGQQTSRGSRQMRPTPGNITVLAAGTAIRPLVYSKNTDGQCRTEGAVIVAENHLPTYGRRRKPKVSGDGSIPGRRWARRAACHQNA